MDILMVVLRLFHIFSGIYWVGASLFLLMVLIPAIRTSGPAGDSVMRNILLKTPYATLYIASSVLTTLAGVILYLRVSGGFNADWFGASQNIVLSIGAVAGLLAFGHGAGALGPKSEKMKKLAAEIEAQDTVTEAQMSEFEVLTDFLARHGLISLILMIIAVVGMAGWRYV